MKHEPDVIHRVPAFEGKTQNPTFNFKKVHRIEDVNDYILEYFVNGNVSTKLTKPPEILTRPCLCSFLNLDRFQDLRQSVVRPEHAHSGLESPS